MKNSVEYKEREWWYKGEDESWMDSQDFVLYSSEIHLLVMLLFPPAHALSLLCCFCWSSLFHASNECYSSLRITSDLSSAGLVLCCILLELFITSTALSLLCSQLTYIHLCIKLQLSRKVLLKNEEKSKNSIYTFQLGQCVLSS